MIKATTEELNNYDRVFYPNRYRKTCIETSKGNRCCDIPVEDAVKLGDIYERIPQRKIKSTPEEFILNLSYRFYTEWCENTPGEKHRDYSGQSFIDFMNDETHYALERTGKTKSEEAEIREKVLEGLVKRSIELFSDWNGQPYPPCKTETDESGRITYIYEDKRNLRCDLREYIGF